MFKKYMKKINEDPNAAKVCGNSDLFKQNVEFCKTLLPKIITGHKLE